MKPRFRAWDKELQTMLDVSLIDFKKGVLVGEHWEFGETNFMNFDEIVLMQSTKILDKNSQEIFEGDILAFETDDEVIKVNVFWDEEHALFMFESKKYNEQELLAELVENNTYPFEIIGNIYENPELLEDK
jgi:uncharacterized phage protein (TIGR01671 family)